MTVGASQALISLLGTCDRSQPKVPAARRPWHDQATKPGFGIPIEPLITKSINSCHRVAYCPVLPKNPSRSYWPCTGNPHTSSAHFARLGRALRPTSRSAFMRTTHLVAQASIAVTIRIRRCAHLMRLQTACSTGALRPTPQPELALTAENWGITPSRYKVVEKC